MIKYITYKKQELPVRISFYALKMVKEETDKSLLSGKEIENDELLEVLEPLLFYGLKAGHEAEDKDFNIEREKVDFILDANLGKFVKMLPEFFKQMRGEVAEPGESDEVQATEKKN